MGHGDRLPARKRVIRVLAGGGDTAREPVALDLRACGYLFAAHTEQTLDWLRANVAVQNAGGVPSRIVDPDEAAGLVPGLATETLVGAAGPLRDGLHVAAGFSGHGFMIAPAVARIVADGIQGRRDPVLDVLDLARFEEGRPVPEPQVV